MKIRTRILCTLLALSALVALVGGLAVDRQRAAVMISATKEAENVARVLGLVLKSNQNQVIPSAQEIVTRLHEMQGRDVTLIDSQRNILADAIPANAGTKYKDDPHGEVEATIRDGQMRTFLENSRDYPAPIKQIVVQVKSGSGQTLGAVILEYTPLFNELMGMTRETVLQVAVAACGSVGIAFLIAFFMGRSIAAPVEQLRAAAIAVAAGKTDVPMPPPRADEIGQLAAAFETMVSTRRRAEEALRKAHAELEVRVAERTAELAKSNDSLRLENIERRRIEHKLSIEYAVSKIIAASPTWEQAMRDVLETLCGILGWDAGAFWMTDYRAGVLRCEEIWIRPEIPADKFKARSREMTFERGAGLPGRVWATGQSAWIRDVTEDANFPRAGVAKEAGFHGAITFPVVIGSGVGGVVEFFSRQTCESDGDLLQAFSAIGNQLGQFYERKRAENHLIQSQKMETVGKLAGGIAHEFNSIMTAIIGRSELLLDEIPSGERPVESVLEIRKAAERAATLTRQLLAYGRRQFLQPEILDLNAVLGGMESMLRHLMGREVDLRVISSDGLKAVKADAGQIEQVVINIAMNAADAMPNGGRLVIETSNITLDAVYASRFPEVKAGDYVMLAIADTGAGMTEEVRVRAFEPFFTTKDIGKGSGLGLATCHGIIKQSGGHIAIYSEIGRGTTIKIYLPQAEPGKKSAAAGEAPRDLPRGTETILLVEDDPSLRDMAATLLGRLGYKVLTALNGVDAMSVIHRQDRGYIDLLFTDVVMPQMSGNELADRIRALHPQTKILFTTAYTESAAVYQGALGREVVPLQKPYTPSVLARKIREILDATKA